MREVEREREYQLILYDCFRIGMVVTLHKLHIIIKRTYTCINLFESCLLLYCLSKIDTVIFKIILSHQFSRHR